MSRAIVADFDLEANGVTFGWCTIATSERFHRHQISIGFDDDSFFQVIANGGWIRLIARRSGGDIGQCVSAFANINGSC